MHEEALRKPHLNGVPIRPKRACRGVRDLASQLGVV
jgi:hypothetical protein